MFANFHYIYMNEKFRSYVTCSYLVFQKVNFIGFSPISY